MLVFNASARYRISSGLSLFLWRSNVVIVYQKKTFYLSEFYFHGLSSLPDYRAMPQKLLETFLLEILLVLVHCTSIKDIIELFSNMDRYFIMLDTVKIRSNLEQYRYTIYLIRMINISYLIELFAHTADRKKNSTRMQMIQNSMDEMNREIHKWWNSILWHFSNLFLWKTNERYNFLSLIRRKESKWRIILRLYSSKWKKGEWLVEICNDSSYENNHYIYSFENISETKRKGINQNDKERKIQQQTRQTSWNKP